MCCEVWTSKMHSAHKHDVYVVTGQIGSFGLANNTPNSIVYAPLVKNPDVML